MIVYKAISAVAGDLASIGIAKDRRNTQGAGYNFRSIDDVLNALASILVKNGLVILPRMVGRESIERQAKSGGALYYVCVEAEFDLVAVEDGSKHTIRTFGEAMDSSDKATNKAMSAAYKYAAIQAFCIPTEGDNDADAHTPIAAPQFVRCSKEQEQKIAELVQATGTDIVAMFTYFSGQAGRELVEFSDVSTEYAAAMIKALEKKAAK